MKPIVLLTMCLLAFAGENLKASDIFTYQGKLTDAESIALPDGQYRIGVHIWEEPSGGEAPLWARKYDVPVVDGLFSLMIGAEGTAWDDPEPLTSSLKLALSGTNRFVEITVMSDADGLEKLPEDWQVLSPRQSLNSVPYAMNGVPPGTVVPFAGNTVPKGWLLCDGSRLDGSDPRYAALFATIGGIYGGGVENAEGGIDFNIPDLRGRTAIGSGHGDGLTNWSIGATVGSESHTLTVAQMPRHNHGGRTGKAGKHAHFILHDTLRIRWGDGGGYSGDWIDAAGASGGSGKLIRTDDEDHHDHTIGYQGDGAAHPIMQPSLVLHYIIKL